MTDAELIEACKGAKAQSEANGNIPLTFLLDAIIKRLQEGA